MPPETPDDVELQRQCLSDQAFRLLEHGPMRLSELTDALIEVRGLGFLRARLEERGRRIAHNSVINSLDLDPRFSSGKYFTNEAGDDDKLIVRTDVVMTGRVFTTQVTEADHATDSLCIDHDLLAFDELLCGVDDFTVNGLPGTFTIDDDLGRREISGSAGWLEDIPPGSMVTVEWHDGDVRVERFDEPLEVGPAESEALLRYAAEEPPRYGFDVADPVLRQLVDDPAAYSSPIAPITEMMRAGGFEHRNGWFGRVGSGWNEPDVAQALDRRSHIAEQHGFDECCFEAFDALMALWDRHLESVVASQVDTTIGNAAMSCRHDIAALLAVGGTPAVGSAGEISYEQVARLLLHESVGDAFYLALCRCIVESTQITVFVMGFVKSALETVPSNLAGLLHLLGRVVEDRAEFDEAIQLYQDAHAQDPSFAAPCHRLAWLAFDQSRFGETRQWLDRNGVPSDSPEYRFLPAPPSGDDRPGRNARCPCGSGRKYKACHVGEPALSPWQRLQLKYDRHVTITKSWLAMRMKAFIACDFDAERADRFDGDAFLADLQRFEGGGLSTFSHKRRALFPSDEMELTERIAASRLQIYEITEVANGRLSLRPIGPDRAVPPERSTAVPLDRSGRSVGDRLVARLIDLGDGLQIVGEVLDLPPDAPLPLFEDLADGDPPDDKAWATWYIALVEASPQCATL